MGKMHPQDVPEALTSLYLRLNGFFTTGLVLHSEKKGQSRGDIDCLAVWHPFHDQHEREMSQDPVLDLRNRVELLICEVKSSSQALSFNTRLRTDQAALNAVLRWSGLVRPDRLSEAIDKVLPLVQDGVSKEDAAEGVVFDEVRIRALPCCPGCTADQVTDRWCVCGDQMMAYANKCLNPARRRSHSATEYPLRVWGGFLEPLVSYFKSVHPDASPTFKDLMVKVGAVTDPSTPSPR